MYIYIYISILIRIYYLFHSCSMILYHIDINKTKLNQGIPCFLFTVFHHLPALAMRQRAGPAGPVALLCGASAAVEGGAAHHPGLDASTVPWQ